MITPDMTRAEVSTVAGARQDLLGAARAVVAAEAITPVRQAARVRLRAAICALQGRCGDAR